MRFALNVFGALFVVIGAVWAGQGANLIGGSFMTGEQTWLMVGGAMALAGLALLIWARALSRHL